MKFDMNAAWSRGVALMRDNFQLLLVIAAVFLLLPTVAIYLLIPDFQTFANPMADPEIMAERMGEIIVPLIAGVLIASVFQFTGYGAMIALMGDTRPTVGQAIASGLKIVPSVLAVAAIFAIAYFLGALVIVTPITLLAAAVNVPALSVIGVLGILVFIVWLMARMSLTMPALVLSGSLNPITAITASFRLTGPSQWMIVLFWGMIFAVFFIISLLFTGTIGIIAALIGNGVTSALIVGLANGAMGVVSGMLICALGTAMFTQLSGPSAAAIEDTFE